MPSYLNYKLRDIDNGSDVLEVTFCKVGDRGVLG